jgi:hypothetical protein
VAARSVAYVHVDLYRQRPCDRADHPSKESCQTSVSVKEEREADDGGGVGGSVNKQDV